MLVLHLTGVATMNRSTSKPPAEAGMTLREAAAYTFAGTSLAPRTAPRAAPRASEGPADMTTVSSPFPPPTPVPAPRPGPPPPGQQWLDGWSAYPDGLPYGVGDRFADGGAGPRIPGF